MYFLQLAAAGHLANRWHDEFELGNGLRLLKPGDEEDDKEAAAISAGHRKRQDQRKQDDARTRSEWFDEVGYDVCLT